MPRHTKRDFIGPRTEDGCIRSIFSIVAEKEKRGRRSKQIFGYKKRAQRIIEKGQRPKELEQNPLLDSATIHERQSKWLDKNSYVLSTFLVLRQREELERQKEQARKGGHTRRLRILENGFSYYSLTQVLVTYGKNCHICFTPIDLKASRRVGIGDWFLGLHIDHLIPIARGGPDTLENVRPSHAICNLRKGIN